MSVSGIVLFLHGQTIVFSHVLKCGRGDHAPLHRKCEPFHTISFIFVLSNTLHMRTHWEHYGWGRQDRGGSLNPPHWTFKCLNFSEVLVTIMFQIWSEWCDVQFQSSTLGLTFVVLFSCVNGGVFISGSSFRFLLVGSRVQCWFSQLDVNLTDKQR